MAEVVPGGVLRVSGCWVADASAAHVLMLMNSVFLFYRYHAVQKDLYRVLFFSFEQCQVDLGFSME